MANLARITVTNVETKAVVASYTVPISSLAAEMKAMYASNKTIGWYQHNGIARGLRWTYSAGTRRVDVAREV